MASVDSQVLGCSSVSYAASDPTAEQTLIVRHDTPDKAIVPDVTSQGQVDSAILDDLQKTRVRAVDLVLAEFG
jgi:hypothetical protein